MAKKSEVCIGKYFRAADCPEGWAETKTIEMARVEDVGRDNDKKEKLVVYFLRTKPGLVCGPTLWDQLIEASGEEDSNDWKGHVVELYRTMTSFGGKQVPCIRVRKPGAPPKKTAKAKAAPPPAEVDLNDSIDM